MAKTESTDKEFILQGNTPYRYEFHVSDGVISTPKSGDKPIVITEKQAEEIRANPSFADMEASKGLRFLDHMPGRFKDNSASIAEAQAKARDAEQKAKEAQSALKANESIIADLKAKLESQEGTDEAQKKLEEQSREIADLKAKLKEKA